MISLQTSAPEPVDAADYQAIAVDPQSDWLDRMAASKNLTRTHAPMKGTK